MEGKVTRAGSEAARLPGPERKPEPPKEEPKPKKGFFSKEEPKPKKGFFSS